MKNNVKERVRIVILAILITIVGAMLFLEIAYSNRKSSNTNLKYNKQGEINYVTYLKNNDHFNNSFLEDKYNFVANLIDYFNVDYNYTYVLNEKIDYELEYNVDAVLDIYDNDNKSKPIESKTFTLQEKTKEKSKGQVIKVNIFNNKIEYAVYNKIIQGWKKEISPNANLKVTFNVKWKGYSKTLKKDISDTFEMKFDIPISEKTITIVKPNKVDESGVIKNKASISKWVLVLIGFTIIVFIALSVCMVLMISHNVHKRSKYDAKLKRILREFDRAITEVKGSFTKTKGSNYIEVKEFMELMDAHDNLNEPILYYKNNENKSVFTVRNGKDIYFYTIDRKDFDK